MLKILFGVVLTVLALTTRDVYSSVLFFEGMFLVNMGIIGLGKNKGLAHR